MTAFSLWMREVQRENPFIDTGNLAFLAWEEGFREGRRHILTALYDLARVHPDAASDIVALATEVEARLAAENRRPSLRDN